MTLILRERGEEGGDGRERQERRDETRGRRNVEGNAVDREQWYRATAEAVQL